MILPTKEMDTQLQYDVVEAMEEARAKPSPKANPSPASTPPPRLKKKASCEGSAAAVLTPSPVSDPANHRKSKKVLRIGDACAKCL